MHQNIQNEAMPRRSYSPLPSTRYPSLDMWRGLACLMILFLHAGFYSKLDASVADQLRHPIATKILLVISKLSIGVPMFFVISGYCISATADSSRRKMKGTVDYFKRRLRRIFPPYWVALGFTVLVFAIAAPHFPRYAPPFEASGTLEIPSPSALSPTQWLGNVTLTEKWRHNIFGKSESEALPPAWTLCYEEQFYAVCGLLLLLMPKRFFAGSVIVSVASAFILAWTVKRPQLAVQGFFFDGKWLMFAAGILVYYALNYCRLRGKWISGMLLLLGVVAIKVGLGKLKMDPSDEIGDTIYSLYEAMAFALLLLILRPWDAAITRAKILKPIALCGQMCYSLYLVHWPIAKVLGGSLYFAGVRGNLAVLTITVPVIVAISIPAAWMFYRLVERHFLNSASNAQSRVRLVPITTENAPMLSGVGDGSLN